MCSVVVTNFVCCDPTNGILRKSVDFNIFVLFYFDEFLILCESIYCWGARSNSGPRARKEFLVGVVTQYAMMKGSDTSWNSCLD